jgi:ubiquinone/menaquinone biosynthesis C-methylase UbiE
MPPRTHDSFVADQFSPSADAYVVSAVHAHGQDLDALSGLIGSRPEARAVDLGSGGGHMAFALSPLTRSVVAYDLSPAMLEAVEAEAQRRGLANVQTRQGSVEALPWPDGSFDVVASRYSAHHWRDVNAGLREARRVLKSGGLAVFADVVAPEDPLLDTWLHGFELLRDPSHVRNYSLPQWRTMVEAAGLKPTRCERYRIRLEFSTWIARMNTPPVFVSAIRALQAKADDEVVRYFGVEADGSFWLDTMLMTAEG